MNILVLGATGRTGGEFLDVALARGHAVSAFVRSPHKITRRDPGLTVLRGDPQDEEALALAMAGKDAVVTALGPRGLEAFSTSSVLGASAGPTLRAMGRARVRRLLAVSTAFLYPDLGPLAGVLRRVFKGVVVDARAMEAVFTASSLDFTIARPGRLVQNRGEIYRARSGDPQGAPRTLSFRAVACFLADAVEQGTYLRKIVALSR